MGTVSEVGRMTTRVRRKSMAEGEVEGGAGGGGGKKKTKKKHKKKEKKKCDIN